MNRLEQDRRAALKASIALAARIKAENHAKNQQGVKNV